MKQAETPRCSDRVDRARIGGLSGSVLGTIAATIFGTPALGLAYQSAGYIMGFASGHPCPDSSLGVEAPAMAQPLPVSQVTEEDI